MRATTKSTSTDVMVQAGPTLHTIAPDWLDMTEKLRVLSDREEAITKEMAPLLHLAHQSGLANWQELNISRLNAPERPKRPKIEIRESVKALLGKFVPAEVSTAPEIKPDPEIVARLRQLGEELSAVREAIGHIRDRRPGERFSQIERARLEGSSRLFAELKPEYDAIVGKICDALVALGNAHIEHEEFMLRHVSAARSLLRPMIYNPNLGDPIDPSSELRRMLSWAIECGHFDAASIPAGWTKKAQPHYPWPNWRDVL